MPKRPRKKIAYNPTFLKQQKLFVKILKIYKLKNINLKNLYKLVLTQAKIIPNNKPL